MSRFVADHADLEQVEGMLAEAEREGILDDHPDVAKLREHRERGLQWNAEATKLMSEGRRYRVAEWEYALCALLKFRSGTGRSSLRHGFLVDILAWQSAAGARPGACGQPCDFCPSTPRRDVDGELDRGREEVRLFSCLSCLQQAFREAHGTECALVVSP